MGKKKNLIYFYTHNRLLTRNVKIINTLKEFFNVCVREPIVKVGMINFSPKVMVGLATLNLIFNLSHIENSLNFIDGRILPIFSPQFNKIDIIDYPTPVHEELPYMRMGYLSKFSLIAERTIISKSKLIIVPNEPLKRLVLSYGAQNVIKIPNYPPKSFKPTVDAEEFKEKLGLTGYDKIAIFVGRWRLREIYGLDLLIESWKYVESEVPDSLLIIVGPSKRAKDFTKNKLERYLEKRGISNYIVTGEVNYKELPNWINIADVCLAPRTSTFPKSWYNDEDSTKISEYAALRKPIVATNYLPSKRYYLTQPNPKAFANGILKAFMGLIPKPEPKFWEENIPKLIRSILDII